MKQKIEIDEADLKFLLEIADQKLMDDGHFTSEGEAKTDQGRTIDRLLELLREARGDV